MTDLAAELETTRQRLRNISRDVYDQDPSGGTALDVQMLARACRIADANLKAHARELARSEQPAPLAPDAADYLRRALDYADEITRRTAAIRSATVEGGAEPGPLCVRNAILRQTHEAIRTRLGILLPVCGTQLRNPVEAEPGSAITCPFCNGTESPIIQEQR